MFFLKDLAEDLLLYYKIINLKINFTKRFKLSINLIYKIFSVKNEIL